MADNTTLDPGSGGDTFRADDIGGVKYPGSKISLGADGTDDGFVSSANPLPVTVSSSPLPSGAATEVTLAAVKTAVELIDNAISGSEMQVDVVAALPAGTNAIGKLALNDGVDIGDVTINNASLAVTQSGTWTIGAADNTIGRVKITDGTEVANVNANNRLEISIEEDNAGIGGGGTQYTEGDTDASITGTAFMWEDSANTLRAVSAAKPLPVDITDTSIAVTSASALDVSAATVTVAGTGTFAVQAAQSGTWNINNISGAISLPAGAATETTLSSVLTAVEKIDDPVLVDDAAFTPATSSVMMVGFTFDDTTPDSVNEGDGGAARMSARREVYTQLRDAAGNERGANVNASNELTVAASQSGTWNITNISGTVSLPTGAATETTLDAVKTAVETIDNAISGSEMQVDIVSSAAIPVTDNAGSLTVDNAGTFAVQAAQSGTWNINNVSGTISLPTGAATETTLDAVKTAVETIDNAISGSEMQVDVVTIPDTSIEASATVTGLTPYFDSDGDNTAQTIKASSGRLYALEVSNPNSSDAYIQLFDESGAITVGTTTPKQSYFVPAGNGTDDGAMDKSWTIPITFANSIKYACTTTATGNTDPTTGLIVNALYA